MPELTSVVCVEERLAPDLSFECAILWRSGQTSFYAARVAGGAINLGPGLGEDERGIRLEMDLTNYNPDRAVWTPPGGPPQTDRVPTAVYEAMGEENIIGFTRAFYHRLAASSIAHLFPKGERNLMAAADRSATMNVFLFGGPHLYQQRYGPPRLRMRHMPFVIDEAGRREWMRCFRETLAEAPEKFGMPAEHVDKVEKFYEDFSGWMVNSALE